MFETPPGSWVIDPEMLASMRMDKAHRALDQGDPHLALVEAEELLTQRPDDLDALFLAGDAALRMGDAATAAQAFQAFLRAKPDTPTVRAGLAAAKFELADLAGALHEATTALSARPDLAEAWYYAGLVHERTGHADQALDCFGKAHALDPRMWPMPAEPPPEAWDEALDHALLHVPQALQEFLAEIPLVWDGMPPIEELLQHHPPLSPFIEALAVGAPPEDQDPWAHPPTSIRLFQKNLGRPLYHTVELSRRIQHAIVAELAQWLGLPPDWEPEGFGG